MMTRVMVMGGVIAIFSLATGPTDAGLCVPATVQRESPYHYIASLTEALSYAKSGLDRGTQRREGARPLSDFEVLVNLKLAKADFKCAGSQVSGYTESVNEAIKTSAEGTSLVFELIARLHDKSVAEFKALLDSISEGKLKPGTVLERQAELAASYDDAWKLLIPMVIAGTYAVVEENPKTGLMSGLALTKVQREEILQKLRAAFGDEITHGVKAGQLPLTAAASALYQVVGDPRRQLRAP